MNTSHASAPALAAQHTPGPWRFETWDYSHANPPRRELVVQNSEMPLATVAWDEGKDNPYTVQNETALANARLIAAAPDLLAALEAAHRSLVTCNSCHGIGTLPTASERTEIESATLVARAAITKATT